MFFTNFEKLNVRGQPICWLQRLSWFVRCSCILLTLWAKLDSSHASVADAVYLKLINHRQGVVIYIHIYNTEFNELDVWRVMECMDEYSLMSQTYKACNLWGASHNAPYCPVGSNGDMSRGSWHWWRVIWNVLRWKLLELNNALCYVCDGLDEVPKCVKVGF